MRRRGGIKDKSFEWISKKRRQSYHRWIRSYRKAPKINGQYRLRYRKRSFGNPDYRGELTVLVGPKTRSAGTTIATVLKRKRKAKLIGYLNSGSTKTACFSPPGFFRLSHTGIRLKIPVICFDRHADAAREGQMFKPDITIDPIGLGSADLNSQILKTALNNLGLLD